MSNLIIGIGILINDLGEVLIAQRNYNQSMGGLWEFPGGKKEDFESAEVTIKREILEELGIDVQVKDKLIEFDYNYKNKKFHFVVHICKLISGHPKPLESLRIKWVHPSNLFNYAFPKANTFMIDALNHYLFLDKDN